MKKSINQSIQNFKATDIALETCYLLLLVLTER